MIFLENIYKSFGDKVILNNITLSVKQDDSLVVLGGSGAGKSVLIKIMAGLLLPDKGKALMDNINIATLSDMMRCQIMLKVGFLFQSGALFDSMNIFENIVFALNNNSTMSKLALKELAKEKLHQVGLKTNILNLYPADLSGGMQKRVALARTICSNPKVVFFDEPTTGLDPIMSDVINNLILKLKEEIKATIITVTHDIQTLKTLANKIVMLKDGKIILEAKSINDLKSSQIPYVNKFINF